MVSFCSRLVWPFLLHLLLSLKKNSCGGTCFTAAGILSWQDHLVVQSCPNICCYFHSVSIRCVFIISWCMGSLMLFMLQSCNVICLTVLQLYIFRTLLVDHCCPSLVLFYSMTAIIYPEITDILVVHVQPVTKGITAQFTASGSHLGVNRMRQGRKMALSVSGSWAQLTRMLRRQPMQMVNQRLVWRRLHVRSKASTFLRRTRPRSRITSTSLACLAILRSLQDAVGVKAALCVLTLLRLVLQGCFLT